MNISFYQFKPRFQSLLRPLVHRLFLLGVTANQVTIAACLLSLGLGLTLCLIPALDRAWFALIPAWMLLRMALNAVDGMLAREHGQQSVLGAYLNELSDVVSDAALYLPFMHITPLQPMAVGLIAWLSALSEMAGLQGACVGASRRYDGPMGKSDRAAVFGALGLGVAACGQLPPWTAWLLPVVALLTAWTVLNRVRAGIAEGRRGQLCQGGAR